MSDEHVIKLDVGCHPCSGNSSGVLLQSENTNHLLFYAVSNEKYEDMGVAVMEFKGLCQTRFGSPNDEALPEHPLYDKGLSECAYCICEVINSTWAKEDEQRGKVTAMRIWRDLFEKVYKDKVWSSRHFIVSFHEDTFECLADDFTLTLHEEPYKEVFEKISRSLFEY